MRLLVQHKSRYTYDAPAALGPHVLRLRPASHARARIESYGLRVSPEHALRWQQDPFGNHVARLTFPLGSRAERLEVVVEMAVELHPVNPFDFFLDDAALKLPFEYPAALRHELRPFLDLDDPSVRRGPRCEAFFAELPTAGPTIDLITELNRLVNARVRYVIREEAGIWSPEETLEAGRGSCRDSATLLIAALRSRGLAARFASGYLIQLRDEGMIPDEPRGMDRDVVDLHAWAEVFLPGAGWIGLDATSGLFCGEGHIPLACTARPALAAPLEGSSDRPAARVDFTMSVGRLGHEARPTAPYAEETWAELLRAGASVDAALTEAGLQLTSGGEPTLNSREQPSAPEWNGEALGPSKWTQGVRLAKALRASLEPGAALLVRQGKHYPGESLPRWAIDIVSRRDGEPLWRDGEVAEPTSPPPGAADSRAGPTAAKAARESTESTESTNSSNSRNSPETLESRISPDLAPEGAERVPLPRREEVLADLAMARRLGLDIARRLGVDGACLQGAFEDPWPQLLEESRLPLEVDPRVANLDDDEERRRLARLLARGMGAPAGFVLPLTAQGDGWRSERWAFRREQLFLLPGDSPVGLRLPLRSLAPSALPEPPLDPRLRESPVDPRKHEEPTAGLAWLQSLRVRADGRTIDGPAGAPQSAPLEDSRAPVGPVGVRTALCVEPRGGELFVFLPPLSNADDFIALVAAVDDARRDLGVQVHLEGYPPPPSPRLARFSVTPDPGVLEVNVPPSTTFAEHAALLERVFDAGLRAGLHSEKYLVDGRQAGSGGGHHVTLGGPTPIDSPWVRRPELLGSLLTFAQHHPSLSYLFAGLFVGPTSQAPRIDEGRHEALDELELALPRAFHAGDAPPPWLGDLLFRHLLVDLTGNTHRTELCIDKLWDPATPHGQQGLVELRAFEMPSHWRMAAAQVLLARALVAAFARAPYQAPLTRWGRRLHDQFLLPFWLWRDFEDVLAFLRARGVALPEEGFRPFVELRCPLVGTLQAGPITVELRNALEPWNVLGEELSRSGTARYVDSSLERVEVRARGLVPERHALLVNGYLLPLRPTGKVGEAVGGVRFRAWAPAHSLHAHIGLHHPLRFDVVDRWAKRSLGACAYHVWHPEGRAFVTPPLTRFEASARRAQRFTHEAGLPWPAVPEACVTDRGDYTLDLRRFPADKPVAPAALASEDELAAAAAQWWAEPATFHPFPTPPPGHGRRS